MQGGEATNVRPSERARVGEIYLVRRDKDFVAPRKFFALVAPVTGVVVVVVVVVVSVVDR